jgi:membrane protein involved in colicin uptake
LYDAKKQTAELENREFTLQFEGYRDNQIRQLKYYIETGELFNRKKETQQEKALMNIAKLEKKLAAEAKAAEAAKAKAAKAAEAKAKAEAEAAQAAAEAEQVIEDICTIIDDDPQGASAVQSDLLGVIDDAQAAQAAADAQAAQAAADKVQADKVQVQAQAAADKTKKELDKVKAKLATLSAPKAENNKNDPKLDFKVLNFSQDCKDTAAMLLIELEREASAPELLYLAKLILDKYNK